MTLRVEGIRAISRVVAGLSLSSRRVVGRVIGVHRLIPRGLSRSLRAAVGVSLGAHCVDFGMRKKALKKKGVV